MKFIIILFNKFISLIGKVINKGSSLPGKLSLKLDRSILKKIELPSNIIFVTGSNGKTSTTEIICNILKKSGLTVCTNKEGSNQIEGVATAILNACILSGKVKKDIVVLEVDERYLKDVCKYITPKYIAITNIYRDQMTRNSHPEFVYGEIEKALDEKVNLILNADDPLSSKFGFNRDNVTYFGIDNLQSDSSENNSVYDDGKYCPICKSKLEYEYHHFLHVGKYKCSQCNFKREVPLVALTSLNDSTKQVTINSKYDITVPLLNIASCYNILLAFTVAKLVGINEDKIAELLNNYILKNDRTQMFKLENKNCVLLTSKHENSISYDQSLQFIISENKPCCVVVIVDAISRKYFTSETSWLWDIDFELLKAECVKEVVLAGKYVNDLMTRFTYIDGMNKEKIKCFMDLDEMMTNLKQSQCDNIYVVTCFSDRIKFLNRR